MNPQTEQIQTPVPGPKTDRDITKENPAGFAEEAEPTWAPPETQPEPRPVEPILNQD